MTTWRRRECLAYGSRDWSLRVPCCRPAVRVNTVVGSLWQSKVVHFKEDGKQRSWEGWCKTQLSKDTVFPPATTKWSSSPFPNDVCPQLRSKPLRDEPVGDISCSNSIDSSPANRWYRGEQLPLCRMDMAVTRGVFQCVYLAHARPGFSPLASQ